MAIPFRLLRDYRQVGDVFKSLTDLTYLAAGYHNYTVRIMLILRTD